MKTQSNKLFVLWNIILGVALLFSLGANALWVQASNALPPESYSMTLNAGGTNGATSTNAPDITSSDSLHPTTILTLPIKPAGTSQWTCTVIASVQANHNGAGTYILQLWKESGHQVDSDRTYEFTANADNDEGYINATTMTVFRRVPSNGTTTTFTLRGYKTGGGMPNGIVGNASLNAICFDTKLK